MIPYDDSDFESRFQVFMAQGGFSQPALREDLERELLDADPEKEEVRNETCPHGNRPLQCGKCYFESGY